MYRTMQCRSIKRRGNLHRSEIAFGFLFRRRTKHGPLKSCMGTVARSEIVSVLRNTNVHDSVQYGPLPIRWRQDQGALSHSMDKLTPEWAYKWHGSGKRDQEWCGTYPRQAHIHAVAREEPLCKEYKWAENEGIEAWEKIGNGAGGPRSDACWTEAFRDRNEGTSRRERGTTGHDRLAGVAAFRERRVWRKMKRKPDAKRTKRAIWNSAKRQLQNTLMTSEWDCWTPLSWSSWSSKLDKAFWACVVVLSFQDRWEVDSCRFHQSSSYTEPVITRPLWTQRT